MPPSLWVKTGFQICIFVGFLLFAIITIATAVLHIHLAKQRDELYEKINKTETRDHRGISLESNVVADDLSANKEMAINGTVMDGVLVEGTLTLTVRVNDTKNGKGFPIDPRIPTVAPFSVIPTIRDGKKANIIISKAPNSELPESKHSGFDQSTNVQTDPVSFDKKSDIYEFENEDTRLNVDPEMERETAFGEIRKENNPTSKKEKKRDSVETEASYNIDLPVESDLRPNEKPIKHHLNVETYSEGDSEFTDSPNKEFDPFINQTSKSDLESKLNANATAIFPDHDIVTRSSDNSEIDSLIETSSNDSKSDMPNKNETLGNDSNMQTDSGIASAREETLPSADPPQTDMRSDSDPPGMPDESGTEHELHEQLPTPLNAKKLSSVDITINNKQRSHSKRNFQSKNLFIDPAGSLLKIAKNLNADHSSIEGAAKIMQRLKRSVPISPSFRRNVVKSRRDHLHGVPDFKNVLKSSFVGYPAFYGLWSKGGTSRHLVQHEESLRQFDNDLTGNNNAHPLSMNGILKEMMALKRGGAKMGKLDENHPFYMKKYRPQFANPLPQGTTHDDSIATMQDNDMTTMSMSTMQANDMTTMPMSTIQASDMTTMSMSTMQADDMTTMPMSTMQTVGTSKPDDMTTMPMSTMMSMSTMMPMSTMMSMSTMMPNDMTTMSTMTTECGNDDCSEEIIEPERDPSDENCESNGDPSEENCELDRDPSEETCESDGDPSEENCESDGDPSEENCESDGDPSEENCGDPSEENCESDGDPSEENCESDGDPSEENFESDGDYGEGGSCDDSDCFESDCGDMKFCNLHNKFDSKKTARNTLKDLEVSTSGEKPILKKIDDIAKRNAASVNRIQKSEHEQGSMKSNLDSSLFSIFAPRKKILRNTLQNDGTLDAKRG